MNPLVRPIFSFGGVPRFLKQNIMGETFKRESGGTMKVSNINVTSIYQDQVKKAKGGKVDGEFRKMMQDSAAEKTQNDAKVFHPPSGINPNNPVLSGAPVAQADPVETVKFAAEVVAKEPDVRAEKVDRIKQLFEAGQYNVPAEAVAERLLASGVMTTSWEG
jgi:flagellar biosynthesis anti-sigma factor FlgM